MPSQIFHKNKSCYIAIEKIATGSLNAAFKKMLDSEYAPSGVASGIKKLFPDYFIFTFIRNPYDRAIYGYGTKGAHRINAGFQPERLKPQSYYFDIDYEQMGFVGRFENLQGDYEKVCEFLNISSPVSLSKIHKTFGKKSYRNYYQNQQGIKDKLFVEDKFKMDIIKFGYEF